VRRSRASRSAGGAAGFSLIEVLVALAIVGLILGAAAGVFGSGLAAHETAADVDTAVSLAQSKLAEGGIAELPDPGTKQGVFAGRFAWRLTVAPYVEPADTTANTAAGAPLAAPAVRLYRITAQVAWRAGRHERRLALSTLRLVAAAK
jgi:general secretion pathway protein I